MANRNKRKLTDVSVDDFMKDGLNTDGSDSSENEEKIIKRSRSKKATKEIKENKSSKMKDSLDKLKNQDPEFYEFMSKEDPGLLNFDESDSSDDESDENVNDGIHKLPTKLEVASDDSEAEESDIDESRHKRTKLEFVTLKMINKWSEQLRDSSSIDALHNAVYALHAAVRQAGGDDVETTQYKVEGSTVFNAVVRLCLSDILPAVLGTLQLQTSKHKDRPPLPSSSKKWHKVKVIMKSYCSSLIKLIDEMSEPAILNVLLKHVHQLVTFYACFPKVYRILMKKLVNLWSTGEETTRVLSFMSINRLIRQMQKSLLEPCLKQMYLAYVKNCKFTSPQTLPLINFMQRSLVELFAIDVNLAYKYAFVYIRQLAIQLRNAITIKKKEAIQSVYNWQYMHCLFLWVRLLEITHPSESLHPLLYPLTQAILGTARLLPTEKYYPLRFQCVRALNMLSESTHTFIPVLPFLLEVFELTDFNKKNSSVSIKPFNFACMLKVSKSQLSDKAFRDGVLDEMYENLLEHFNIHAHSIGFPELVLPAVIQVKQFLKKCKVANYCKQIKQILEKVEENSKFIIQQRKSSSFDVKDISSVNAWEMKTKDVTPLKKFYVNWRKLKDREIQREIAGKSRISHDDKIPTIRRSEIRKKPKKEEKEFADLFDSDSEDSIDDEERFMLKGERKEKLKKDTKQKYSEFTEEELEELCHSGDDDTDDNDGANHNSSINNDDVSDDDDDDDDNDDDKKMKKEDSDSFDEDDIVEDFEMSSGEDSSDG